ncbi:heavy-metal-associated domain-containing protein [Streptomyces bathyalis]|uniref:Heavy-metal-associated domain-containing protein n=1 Tax=Streptomyces bathyalis TaxID=2710756 RepID=A0A7T1WQL8_9ACTN|nr:cation transporter [Streptomyces bathyalis]QPP05336.1 heavy-metal-associated domain-containing protein [Streptomyces bathyalis]
MTENNTVETSESSSCCGSCGTSEASSDQATPAVREIFHVQGMTCGHCVTAVTTELSKVDGVKAVAVDLGTGQVTVDSDKQLPDADVSAAIDEAGYELTGRVAV